MKLVTQEIAAELLANGQEMREHAGTVREPDHKPVVKFFDPFGAATWLITFAEPEEPDILFGLCDLGMGCPELGSVRLSELESIKWPSGAPRIERDLHFTAKHPISAYAEAARAAGRIVENLPQT